MRIPLTVGILFLLCSALVWMGYRIGKNDSLGVAGCAEAEMGYAITKYLDIGQTNAAKRLARGLMFGGVIRAHEFGRGVQAGERQRKEVDRVLQDLAAYVLSHPEQDEVISSSDGWALKILQEYIEDEDAGIRENESGCSNQTGRVNTPCGGNESQSDRRPNSELDSGSRL